MLPTTTPFPVDMPYWDPSWIPMPYPLPLPIPTVTITTVTTIPLPFLNPESLLGLPSNFNFLPTNTPTTTTGSLLPPSLMPTPLAPSSPAINANAKDGSINYYTANYSQPMLSTVPAPSVALSPCAPPAPSNLTAAAPRKCGNCGTTETYRWRSVKSKESIRCFTCYEYRRTTKKERPAAVIKANQLKKMKRI